MVGREVEWFDMMVEWFAKHAQGRIIVGSFTCCQIYLVIVSPSPFILTHTHAVIVTACEGLQEIPAVNATA
jgi:hypothetical protein